MLNDIYRFQSNRCCQGDRVFSRESLAYGTIVIIVTWLYSEIDQLIYWTSCIPIFCVFKTFGTLLNIEYDKGGPVFSDSPGFPTFFEMGMLYIKCYVYY